MHMIASTKASKLESRVAQLESQVQRLFEMLASPPDPSQRQSDWQQAIALLQDDPGMARIMLEAQKYRESDRRGARKRRTRTRRAKS
jgi:hypothetical protein